MPLRLAYTRPDGGVSVVNATPFETLALALGSHVEVVTDSGVEIMSETHILWSREAYRDHVIDRSVPADATNLIEMPDDLALPKDRTFRNAWAIDGKAVVVDMPKARDIHRERLRALRAPLFTALDTDYQRADEALDADAKKLIVARKQALRDVTDDPAIEAAQTPDDLAAVMPSILVG